MTERVEVGPSLVQSDAPAIPAKPLGEASRPATACVRADLREHLLTLKGGDVLEEPETDDLFMERHRADRFLGLHRALDLTLIVLIAGPDLEAVDAVLHDEIGPTKLAKLA